MAIENSNIIDFVSLDKAGTVVLTISDQLEWDGANEHLLLLQEKINAYLNSIESGDLFRKYPEAENKKIAIGLVIKYWPNEDGHIFLERIKELLNSSGYEFYFQKLIDQGK